MTRLNAQKLNQVDIKKYVEIKVAEFEWDKNTKAAILFLRL